MTQHHQRYNSSLDEGSQSRQLDSIFCTLFFLTENNCLAWIPEPTGPPIILHKDHIQISRELLQGKYFEAFNFYFSKPINEILANLSLPHVILYKDYLYYDDENEYLKRYYRTDEIPPRMQNLSKFYNQTSEGLTKPNIAVHEQNKIILKRNNKLHKYYLSKLQNFAEIPQTQRNNKAKEDFKVLNNLHEDDYSDDNFRYKEPQSNKTEERYENMLDNDDHVHNSFQQILERYENATTKVSFESQQHNVYDPDYSSESLKVLNKSTEENLSFDQSLEIYAKGGHERDFALFKKKVLVDSKSSGRVEEKTNVEHGDTEDQIPHNVSDFAFSDASELNLINEIIKNSQEVKPATKLLSQNNKASNERLKYSKQKENEDIDKEKYKGKVVQKIAIPKAKSTSGTHIPNKSSADGFTKKTKTPLEKMRTSKDFATAGAGFQEALNEKFFKSVERNLNRDHATEKTATSAYVSAKREKEGPLHEKAESSVRNINEDFLEKVSPRDLQHPTISIKNIHVNQIKPEGISKESREPKATSAQYDDKNTSIKNRKSAPQSIKKNSATTFKKLSIPNESKINTDRPATSTNSIQYIKGLMEKYQKYSDEVLNNKSKAIYDSNMGSKDQTNYQENNEKSQRIREVYVGNDLYTRVAKKAEPKTNYLSRSKTEDALIKDISHNKLKKPLKESPIKTFENQPSSARRIIVSPTNPRKEKFAHRFVSNEGISPRLISSTTNKLTTQLSSDNSKLHPDNLNDDVLFNTTGNFKSVKVEKIFAYKRSEMKPPMKSTAATTGGSNSNSSNTRRLTAAHTYSGASSIEKNDLIISMPVSPTKRFDLKLNLTRLNQAPGKYNHEATTENSYGFWTSRSVKVGNDEESKYFKNGLKTEDRYKNDSKKDYLLKKNYEPYLETKKKGKSVKKGGSFTNVNHGLKVRETEATKNGIFLKSTTTNETDMNHIYVHDLNEVNSAPKAVTYRSNDVHYDHNILKNDYRRTSKK